MKTKNLHNPVRRVFALALACTLTLTTVSASAGTRQVQTAYPLTRGLDFLDTVTQHDSAGRVESYALELGADSAAYPVLIQGSGTIYATGTINRAVALAQEQGYHVLGAVNTDFFSTSTGVPMGIVIEDGVYKSSPGERNAIYITKDRFFLSQSPQVTLTLTNQSREDNKIVLTNFNKSRAATGGLYLLNEHFSTVSTRTNTPGWMVRMKELDGAEMTLSGQLRLEVMELLQTSESAHIAPGEYILTADDENGMGETFACFQVGDQITLSVQCSDPNLLTAQWASGAGDAILLDGLITDTDGWTYSKDGRQPRTALGVRRDGSSVLYVVDGRRSGYSGGLSEYDLAEELRGQGCVWAVNLDGGGSTAMSVWVPGQSGPAVVNRPSDGTPRGCATYLVLVTDEAGNRRPDRLALKSDGLVALSGTSVDLGDVAVLDSGLNLLTNEAGEVTITSRNHLGTLEGSVYTAGPVAGTDTLDIFSAGLSVWGTGQVHVVTELTELTVSREGSSGALTSLSLKPGEQVQLTATGNYWSRAAMRDAAAVTWTVQGDVGAIDENGLFTASREGGAAGSITATAGGQTRTVSVTLSDSHRDVPEDHWAYMAVEYCYENGLVSGVSEHDFGPDLKIRRGDFLLMLYRMVGSPAVSTAAGFPDVSPDDYYATAIAWAQENRLVSGMADGTFAPTINVTREQSFVILNRVLPLLNIVCAQAGTVVLNQFRDREEIADWAAPFAATLVAYGMVGGSDGSLNPKGSLSRAEMAALLYKLGHYDPSVVIPAEMDRLEEPGEPEESGELGEPEQRGAGFTVNAVVAQDVSALNVRSGPGTGYGILGRLTAGAGVQVLEQAGDGWLHVRCLTEDGSVLEGYISGAYIESV